MFTGTAVQLCTERDCEAHCDKYQKAFLQEARGVSIVVGGLAEARPRGKTPVSFRCAVLCKGLR